MKIYVFDCEGDSLTPKKFHVLSYASKEGIKSLEYYSEMREFLESADVLIGHNIIRWDIPHLERLLEIKIKARLVDTLSLSWCLYPDRNRHGLEGWGEDLGTKKPEITDWSILSYEEYKNRCEADVEINLKLWNKMWKLLMKMYDDEDKCWKFINYISFKTNCIAIQEKNGWKLDVEYVKKALQELKDERDPKVEHLRSTMPDVPEYKKKNKPKSMVKKDGSATIKALEWVDFLKEHNLPENYEEEVSYISGYNGPNPGSTPQIKDWLFTLGWKPATFDYKKKDDGSINKIPKINLERGEGVCPSVLKLIEKDPNIAYLRDLSILNHRIPFLERMLEEVDDKDYVKARASGFTNTLRLKHSELVNLPKIDKPYAIAIRGGLIADEGTQLFGADQSSLEDRIKQHFMYEYDPDLVEEMNTEDYDPHLKLAESAGVVTHEQVLKYKSGEDKSIKPIRDMYKNGNYACQYGAFPSRIALTCSVSKDKAKEIFDAYWEINKSIKEIADDQEVITIDGSMWLKNPINGFLYSLRSKKDIFSTLVQGTASYVFDMWVFFVLEKCSTLIGQFHDELIIRAPEGYEEGIVQYIKDCNEKVNDALKLNRRLDVEVQTGRRYSEIH